MRAATDELLTLDKSWFIERTIEGIAPTVDVRGQPVLS